MCLHFLSHLLPFLFCFHLLLKFISEHILFKIQFKASIYRQHNFVLESYGNALLYITVRYTIYATYHTCMLIYAYKVYVTVINNKNNIKK